MLFLGTIVNAAAIAVGAIIGVLLSGLLTKSKRLSELPDVIMRAVGLCVIYIGISGVFSGMASSTTTLGDYSLLIMIGCIIVGTLAGELIDIDKQLNRLGAAIEAKFAHGSSEGASDGRLARGFVSATLLFCVGAMAITGSIESGLSGGESQATLFAKSALDFVSSIIFGATLGIGAALSAFSVLIYQGAIEAVAIFIESFLPSVVIAQMSAVGSLIIFALGFNMIGLTKFKVANMLPAIFLPLLMCFFY